MATKSLLHCPHSKIGTRTNTAGTATAHMGYIMRQAAMTHFQADHMPEGGKGTRTFFDDLLQGIDLKTKEVRVCDKLMLALPLELTREQRHLVVAGFMQELGKGKIAWCAAHHDAGKDAHNPHAHIVFKDADITDAKRRKVIGFGTNTRDVAEAKQHGWKVPPRMTSKMLGNAWCNYLNGYMQRVGLDIQYDDRSFEERGLDRLPQIHEGAKMRAMLKKGIEPISQDRVYGDGFRPKFYKLTDRGNRVKYNQDIIVANAWREKGQGIYQPGIDQDELKRKQTSRAASRQGDVLTQNKPEIAAAPAREALPVLQPLTKEQIEKNDLKTAHVAAKKIMWKEQKADRAALKLHHIAQSADQRIAAKKRYAEASAKAYATVREKTAPKWATVYGMPKGAERDAASVNLKADLAKQWEQVHSLKRGSDERESAAAALKIQAENQWQAIRGMKPSPERDTIVAGLKAETKTLFAEAYAPKLAEAKQQNNADYQKLKSQQEVDRRKLSEQHKVENSATSKQHIFERHWLHETWQAVHLQRQTNQAKADHAAAMAFGAGMPEMEAKALQVVKLTSAAREQKLTQTLTIGAEKISVPSNPYEAAKVYLAQSKVEAKAAVDLRQQLVHERQFNIRQGGRVVPQHDIAPMPLRGKERAEVSKAVVVLQAVENANRSAQVRDKARSGQVLTADEKLTVSVASILSAKRKKEPEPSSKELHLMTQAERKQHVAANVNSAPERGGGGRER